MRRNPAIKRAIKSVKKTKIICNDTLRNEIETLILLDHPNIIKIFETFEDDNYVHIVMEYSHIYTASAPATSYSTTL